MEKYLTRQQLADIVGVGRKKLMQLLEQHNIELEPRKLISPAQADDILLKLGVTRTPPNDSPNRFRSR